MNKNCYKCSTDVLVIGSGAAGIKAAITAAESGARVLMLGKAAFGRTGATFYPGTPGWGMNAVVHEGDTVDYFFEEITEAGAGCADPKLARIMASECTKRFHELEDYGISFSKDENGKYRGVIPCFGKRVRGSSAYGMGMIRSALWHKLMSVGVTIRDNVSVLGLVKDGGRCVGAVALDEQNEYAFFEARAVVLATGGGCGIFRYSLATPDETGDGYIMALNAGAPLINLEFIQFIPGLTRPVKKLLFQEKNLDTLPRITNDLGEPVLEKYLPADVSVEQCLIERAKHGPFSTVTCSRWFDIAMYEEWLKGNADKTGGVHLAYDKKVLSDDRWVIKSWLKWMGERGVYPVEQGFDMVPHAQCFNGGIRIGADCGAGVPGLYAAGETVGGPHGADRLGGAAIGATQVFGAIAGQSAAGYAGGMGGSGLSAGDALGQYMAAQRREGGIADIPAAMAQIREIMWRTAAIVRSQERCDEGLAALDKIEAGFSPALHYETGADERHVHELQNYITLARLLLTVIGERKESRGPHFRMDYGAPEADFEGPISVRLDGGALKTEKIKFGE